MIFIFLFSFSVNYLAGFKWFEYKQIYRIYYHKHLIETNFRDFSLEYRWETLDIEDWEYKEYYNRYQHLLILGISKPFGLKKFNLNHL